MYGAIIGDLSGSIYEYNEFIDSQNNTINFKRRLDCLNKEILFDNCFYSDDTILTIAILDSILNNDAFEINLKKYGILNKNNLPKNIKYFKYMFSPNFIKWCYDNKIGVSNGNGAMMRISPVGYLFDSEKDIIKYSTLATKPSHNSLSSVESANIVALMIYYFRIGLTKDEAFNAIQNKYKVDLNFSLSELQRTNVFDGTNNVLNKILYIIKISEDFDDGIKKVLSIGGDTDTNACIAGSILESMYGIKEEYIDFVRSKLPDEYNILLDKGYAKVLKYK